MAPEPVPLKYAVFNSKIELPFYSAYFDAKLNHDKLDESVRPLLGLYEASKSTDPNESSLLQIHATALTGQQQVSLPALESLPLAPLKLFCFFGGEGDLLAGT